MVWEKIKCYKSGAHYNKPHFYILNKGRNSGKPLQESCANCFVFIAESPEERQHFYNLCYALWQGKQFHILLTGSVIEFIRIGLLYCIVSGTGSYNAKDAGIRNTLEE